MKLILFLLFTFTLGLRTSADEIFANTPLAVEGKRYEYSHSLTLTVGWQTREPPKRTHAHFVVIHEDEESYRDARMWRGDHDSVPYVSIGDVDAVLAHEGLYLLRKVGGRFRLSWVESIVVAPDNNDEAQLQEWIASTLKNGKITP